MSKKSVIKSLLAILLIIPLSAYSQSSNCSNFFPRKYYNKIRQELRRGELLSSHLTLYVAVTDDEALKISSCTSNFFDELKLSNGIEIKIAKIISNIPLDSNEKLIVVKLDFKNKKVDIEVNRNLLNSISIDTFYITREDFEKTLRAPEPSCSLFDEETCRTIAETIYQSLSNKDSAVIYIGLSLDEAGRKSTSTRTSEVISALQKYFINRDVKFYEAPSLNFADYEQNVFLVVLRLNFKNKKIKLELGKPTNIKSVDVKSFNITEQEFINTLGLQYLSEGEFKNAKEFYNKYANINFKVSAALKEKYYSKKDIAQTILTYLSNQVKTLDGEISNLSKWGSNLERITLLNKVFNYTDNFFKEKQIPDSLDENLNLTSIRQQFSDIKDRFANYTDKQVLFKLVQNFIDKDTFSRNFSVSTIFKVGDRTKNIQLHSIQYSSFGINITQINPFIFIKETIVGTIGGYKIIVKYDISSANINLQDVYDTIVNTDLFTKYQEYQQNIRSTKREIEIDIDELRFVNLKRFVEDYKDIYNKIKTSRQITNNDRQYLKSKLQDKAKNLISNAKLNDVERSLVRDIIDHPDRNLAISIGNLKVRAEDTTCYKKIFIDDFKELRTIEKYVSEQGASYILEGSVDYKNEQFSNLIFEIIPRSATNPVYTFNDLSNYNNILSEKYKCTKPILPSKQVDFVLINVPNKPITIGSLFSNYMDENKLRTYKLKNDFEIATNEAKWIDVIEFINSNEEIRNNLDKYIYKPERYLENTPEGYRVKSQFENEPVSGVSYSFAKKYAEWLSKQDNQYNYRLPTEAEWEYIQQKIYGNYVSDAQKFVNMLQDIRKQKDNQQFIQILLGNNYNYQIVNMLSGVWEWTTNRNIYVLKGGSKNSPMDYLYPYSRIEIKNAQKPIPNVGFRLIRIKK